MGSSLFFGLVPAWQLSRTDVRQVLSASRGAGSAPHGRRLRTMLVFAEVALATVLVVSAALLGRSFAELSRVPIGFDPSHVLTIRASAPSDRYADPGQTIAVFAAMEQRLGAVAGVERVGAIQLLPLTPDNWNPGVVVDGVAEANQYPSDVNWRLVTPGYFDAMSIPLRQGRALKSSDSAGATPVALVNETFARLVLNGNPIGRRIHTGFEEKGEWVDVVGVVADAHQHTIEDPALPEMYRPFDQHPINGMRFMIRTAGDPGSAASSARAAIAAVDPNIAVSDVEPMRAVVDRLFGDRRAPLIVAGFFAVIALTLGLVGVAGVLSFDVAQRRREIGIRLALGATRGDVSRTVFRRGLMLTASGVAAGIGGAVLSANALKSMLFGISATDPATIAGVAVAFVAVMLAAMYVPARRAANVDPLETMKDS
jgi:predicted permease